MTQSWIAIDRIEKLVDADLFILGWALLPFSFAFYFFFLKKISEKRHRNMRRRFRATLYLLILASTFAALFWKFRVAPDSYPRLPIYLSLGALFLGAIAVIRQAQILVYLYLFVGHVQQGVPRLIANLFTTIFSVFVFGMIASYVFDIHFSAFLATSAVFSVVLGLALQDTLGNLFSGLALQLDQPFEIGSWVEIHGDSQQKWMGQIHEITWRATFIMTFSDELVMIPNRIIAQSKVNLLTHGQKPIRLNQLFRFPYGTDLDRVKTLLHQTLSGIPGIMRDPEPRILVVETTESWITVKAFYSIHDFSMRYRIADALLTKVLRELEAQKLPLAHSLLELRESVSEAGKPGRV